MTVRRHTIEFSLMEAGHTKFHPGRVCTLEGQVERQYSGGIDRSGSLYPSLPKLATTLLSSLMTRRVQSISMTGAHTSRFFEPIPHPTTYHHFRYEYTSNFHIMSHTVSTLKLNANSKDADWSVHPESDQCLC